MDSERKKPLDQAGLDELLRLAPLTAARLYAEGHILLEMLGGDTAQGVRALDGHRSEETVLFIIHEGGIGVLVQTDDDNAVVAIDPECQYHLAELMETGDGFRLRHGMYIDPESRSSVPPEDCNVLLPQKRKLLGLCRERDELLAMQCCSGGYEAAAIRYHVDSVLNRIGELFSNLGELHRQQKGLFAGLELGSVAQALTPAA